MTPVQKSILLFVMEYQEKNRGMSPNLTEISKAIGLRTRSGVHQRLSYMEAAGLISRLPDRARSIVVLKPPLKSGAERARWHLEQAAAHLAVEGDANSTMARTTVRSALQIMDQKKVAA